MRVALGKPETFEFLGFTHISARSRAGWFKLQRVTSKKRMRAKLREVKTELMRRRHLPDSRARSVAGGASCVGTAPTTPCPTTARRSRRSATESHGTGGGRSAAAASGAA